MGLKRDQIPDDLMEYFEESGKPSVKNWHPTIKPIDLMKRLLNSIPPETGTVIDPFMGSGTTALACLYTGHDFIGIEREEEYLEIADARVRHWEREVRGGVVGDSPIIFSDKPMPKPEMESLDDMFGWNEGPLKGGD